MKKKKTERTDTDGLRRQAEAKLKKQTERLREISEQDMGRLIHELGTYQIELEIQNEELRRSQAELEESRQRYADLFDFAPVGYFILDRDGVITGSNHTGSVMLGRVKRCLPGSRFADFVILRENPVFLSHLDEVFKTLTRRSCELRMKDGGGEGEIHVQLQSIVVENGSEPPLCMRMAVIDITDKKLAEQGRKQALDRELVVRDEVEKGRRILRAVLKAREQERVYVAREIHDQLGQLLTALSMDLSWINRNYHMDAALSEKVCSMKRITDMGIETV